jgi:O-succinylbenzoic acid--CoA ligase
MNSIDFEDLWGTHSEHAALIKGDQLISYRLLHEMMVYKIKDLSNMGVEAGDHVALLGKTSILYIINFLALLHMDAIAVPLSTQLTATQINDRLVQSGVKKILIQNFHTKTDFLPHIKVYDMEEKAESKDITPLTELPLSQAATIIFTSGSIGSPKAVLHTIGNHYFSALGAAENIPLNPGNRWLLTLPLNHVGGLAIIFRTVLAGAATVIPQDNLTLSENLSYSAASHVSLVPTQLKQLLEENADYTALKVLLLGGAAAPLSMIHKAIKFGLPIYLSYGSTEMASQITATKADDPARMQGTSGHVLTYRTMRIGKDREILVKGLTLSPGYIEGENILPLVDEDGWFHTGDLGSMDPDGRLKIIGRTDNMFISGGENIYPEEIENVLYAHPNVIQSVVVEVPDQKFGYRPVAFLQLTEGMEIDEKDMRRFLSDKIERFKIPVCFFPWPFTAEGLKVPRKRFREYAEQQINLGKLTD